MTIVILCNFAMNRIFIFHSGVLSFVFQTVVLTFLILLFGEILPKLYANNYTLQWAKMAVGGIGAMVKTFSPLSSMLVKSSTTASEIMTPRVDMTDIDITSTFEEVMDVVLSSGFSRLPVYADTEDNIKGVLYSRDLLPYIGRKTENFEWQKLVRETYFVPESRMIDDLLEDFRRRRIHMAIVVDEYGGTQGLVTLEDVLEEIVGDINDEYDEEEITYRKLPDDTYVFEGKTLLTDFFRITDLDEEDYAAVTEDCDTLAGMLLAIKGDFPKSKESIVYGRCRFLVLTIERHRIASVRVKVMPVEDYAEK